MLDWLSEPDAWIALATLIGIELVLAVDNLLFISIVSSRLPEDQQVRARTMGLAFAWFTRMALIVSVLWAVSHGTALFTVFEVVVTIEGLLLICGGAFLIGRSTYEIHQRTEGGDTVIKRPRRAVTFVSVVVQIGLLDMVFSLDSVVTAVGITRHLGVMMIAATVAIGAMMLFATPVAQFVNRTPTLRVLTLAFLMLIGVNLIAEGVGQYIPRGYIYFAMMFALFVEFLNYRAEKRMADREERGADGEQESG